MRGRALLLAALVGCTGGPHGPEELELVPVAEQADEGLPWSCRVSGQLTLPAGAWDLWLPLPSDDDAQRVESLLVQVSPHAQAEQTADRGLQVAGTGPLEVRWRARVVLAPAPEAAPPAAALEVGPLAPPEAWVAALGAAGFEARLRRGLDADAAGPARPGVWVEVRAGEGWVALDPQRGAARPGAHRVALGERPAVARRDGEVAPLDVAYQLSVD